MARFVHTFTTLLSYLWGFPRDAVVKNPPAVAGITGDTGSILGWEDSLEEEMATHSSILAWEIHGQRSLEGCNPWDRRESDKTKHTHAFIYLPPTFLLYTQAPVLLFALEMNGFPVHFFDIDLLNDELCLYVYFVLLLDCFVFLSDY